MITLGLRRGGVMESITHNKKTVVKNIKRGQSRKRPVGRPTNTTTVYIS